MEKTWDKFLTVFGICRPDENGNRPCDTCDKCEAKWIREVYEAWREGRV